MDLKRILVAVNSLSPRDAAFERALALARLHAAELYLLHAVPLNERFSFRAAERLQRMADMRQRAEGCGLRVQTIEQRGDAAEIIELHANARAADLIVMGSEPRRGWARRSAIAERVIRRASVPTLVVASDVAASPTAFRNVVVSVDLSPGSEQVVNAALALTAGDAGQLTVMHSVRVVEPAAAAQSPGWWLVAESRTHDVEDAQRALAAVVSAVPATVSVRFQLSAGSVAAAILEHAAGVNAELIVVGRSGGLKLLGSTAMRLLRKNERALLVIPTNAQRTRRVEQPFAA